MFILWRVIALTSQSESKITASQVTEYFRENGITTNDISFLMGLYHAQNPDDKIWGEVEQYFIVKLDKQWYGTYLKKEPEYTTNEKDAINIV